MSLESLPVELLQRILSEPCLRAQDLHNCAKTTQLLRNVCNNESLWINKLNIHYPILTKHLRGSAVEPKSAKEHYSKLCALGNYLQARILALSNIFVWSLYYDYEWPDIPHRALRLYLDMFDDNLHKGFGRYYILDECYSFIHHGNKCTNITLRYYASKVYYFLKMEVEAPLQRSLFFDNDEPKEVEKFCYLEALKRIANAIPMTDRVDEETFNENLHNLYNHLDDKIRQFRPDIVKNSLRTARSQDSEMRTFCYSRSECIFILKQIHDTVRHDFNLKESNDSIFGGLNYCLDKVLNSGTGNNRIIVALEGHLAQRHGISCDIYEHSDCWYIRFYDKEGIGNSYCCPECSDVKQCSDKNCGLSERAFHESILQDLVRRVQDEIKNAVRYPSLHGGPVLHDLLCEDSYLTSVRNMFASWRLVEHWKISRLRHYMMLLCNVSQEKLLGKIIQLNILLRINSNFTLKTMTDFRRELINPPSGIRDLQRMIASVNIRAKARLTELKALLCRRPLSYEYFLHTFHPAQTRPWPHGCPGSDMIQKRRADRKSQQVFFAVGQVVEVLRSSPANSRVQDGHEGPSTSRSTSSKPHLYPNVDDTDDSEEEWKNSNRSSPSGSDCSSIVGHLKVAADYRAKELLICDDTSSSDTEDNKRLVDVTEPPRKINKLSNVNNKVSELCVIYDWDSMCVESQETLEIIGEPTFAHGRDQPFYRVLLHGGASSYVAQENLRHTKNPRPISNPLLGRYFRAYIHPYYIPNIQKAYEYPEDATIREQDAFAMSLL